jgi:hypothetical protein
MTEGGFELLRRGPEGWGQLPGWGYHAGTGYAWHGRFSDDGRYFAQAFGAPNEWWRRAAQADAEVSCGMVAVIDLTDGSLGFVDLPARVSKGWVLGPRLDPCPVLRAFEEGLRLEVELPNGQVVTPPVDRGAFKPPA